MSIRAMATAILSFGLVAIPVKVYSATSSNGVKFNLLTKAGKRVKQKLTDPSTGKETTHNECLKGYEYAKDQFVVFTAEELKAIEAAGNNDKTIAVLEFVPEADVHSLYIEASYYLGPDKGGDRGYTLLSRTMAKLGKVGIAQWTTHNRDHLVVIRSYENGLMLQKCFYEDEIRDFSGIEIAKFELTKPEELIAERLIKTLSGPFEPSKYEDRYAKRLREAVEKKIAGQEIAVVPEEPTTSVLDLFAALKASVEQVEIPKPPELAKRKSRKKSE